MATSKEKQDYELQAHEILTELKALEYLQKNKLEISIGKSRIPDDKPTLKIVGADGNDSDTKQMKTVWECFISFGAKTVYRRMIDGDTPEMKLHLMKFVRLDIMNSGIMLMNLTFHEQEAMMKEALEKQASRIIT